MWNLILMLVLVAAAIFVVVLIALASLASRWSKRNHHSREMSDDDLEALMRVIAPSADEKTR